MKSNCVERNARFIQSPFSRPPSCFLAPSLLKDIGSDSTNGLWLFVYVQFVRGLASFPLFKEAIYNSIHVYLPQSQCSTVMDQGFSVHAFTKC